MKILKLQLENFRNYESKLIDITENPCIFAGANGLGKTNILEAIYLLSLGRSFRSSNLSDLVRWDQNYFRVIAIVEAEEGDETDFGEDSFKLEVAFENSAKSRKNFKVNSIETRPSEYFSTMPIVLFHPEDLNTLYLSPGLRRKYLDILLSQSSNYYLLALSNYNKLLKQRNALLRAIRDKIQPEDLLDTFDQQLVQAASIIIEHRKDYVQYLTKPLEKYYEQIADKPDKVSVKYLQKLQEDYLISLKNRRQLDIIKGQTSLGPHRDDLIFSINGHEISTAASRGEIRSLLLSLKMSEIDYIHQKKRQKPVLLLDDVFSELDQDRVQKLKKLVSAYQTVITTTD